MQTNSPGCTWTFTSLTATYGPDGVGKTFVRPVSSSGGDQHAVSASTTLVRTRSASRFDPNEAGRGRASGTGMAGRRVARGPGVIGTMRSDRRIASSTLLVIITVVTPPRLGAQLGELLAERLARQRVERAERLVEKQDVRLDRERPRDRDPLAHAA